MGFPAQIDEDDLHFPDDDTVTHFAARELQIILRIGVVLSVIATAMVMVTFYFWVWIPLVGLVACYAGLAVIDRLEKRTRKERYERIAREHKIEVAHELHPEADTPVEGQFLAQDDEHFTPMSLLRKESIIGLEIVVGLGLAAVALTVLGVVTGRLPGELVALAIGLIVVYGLFIMAPVWLALFGDVEDVEQGRPSNERRPGDVTP